MNEVDTKSKEYILYFDGACKSNPGKAGAGMVIYKNNVEIASDSVYIGEKETNNVSEYIGLLIGMKTAIHLGITDLIVRGDSMLVIKQMNGEYKVKSDTLREHYTNAKGFEKMFEKITYEHVYRNKNKRADELANIGVSKK
jgi:ribonuclease HI